MDRFIEVTDTYNRKGLLNTRFIREVAQKERSTGSVIYRNDAAPLVVKESYEDIAKQLKGE